MGGIAINKTNSIFDVTDLWKVTGNGSIFLNLSFFFNVKAWDAEVGRGKISKEPHSLYLVHR